MGYLTAKEDLQIYRSITRIGFDPVSGALRVEIAEGFDRGGIFHHMGQATHDIAGEASGVLTMPLDQVIASLGVTADEITLRGLIVALVDAAITASLAPPAPPPPEPAPLMEIEPVGDEGIEDEQVGEP